MRALSSVMDRKNTTGDDGLDPCGLKSSSLTATYSIFFFAIVAILLVCKIFHAALRRLGQPRIISDFIVGLLIGNVSSLRSSLDDGVVTVINVLPQLGFTAYMFVLGLEMDPGSMLASPGPESAIAYAGILTSLLVALACYPIIDSNALRITTDHKFHTVAAFVLALSTTASPVLTRLTTDLKIGKSEVGRLAVGAGLTGDMVSTLLMCVGVAVSGYKTAPKQPHDNKFLDHILNASDRVVTHNVTFADVLIIFLALTFEIMVVIRLARPVFGWLNDRNPEGRPLKGADVVVAVVMTALLSATGIFFGYDVNMNAFLVGLALPRQGRVSNFMISNINFLLTSFMLPFYVIMVGMKANLKLLTQGGGGLILSLSKMGIIAAIGTIGKVSGTLVAARFHGLRWNEAAALGLLLNVKGYYHIFCAYNAMTSLMIDRNTFVVLLFVIMGTIVYIPAVVAVMVRWARQRAVHQRMGLQWSNPESELRMLVGLRGPENVAMAINVIEAARGGPDEGSGGLVVYVMDMVEMTNRAAASLVQGKGVEAVTVAEEKVVEMREEIGAAMEAYVAEGGEGVVVRRLLAVSAFSDMHVDICNGAEDVRAELIVLPFHKSRRVDGGMDGGHPGFRQVNQKVLRHAPCSVGIMVDRGLSWAHKLSMSEACVNVAVVFIGGADDREALAYAGRIAQHPGIRLTVIRFIPESGGTTAGVDQQLSSIGRRSLAVPVARQGAEMREDDEYFADFYECHVAGNKGVGYMEKHVESGVAAVAVLRAVEGQYQLFVVGRGRERNSVLTAGMEEWAECPELGPIGDILAASEFSVTASVLVIQQHDVRKAMKLIDADFVPM